MLDAYGNISVLRPIDGIYTLTLRPALCEQGEGCFLGGAVAILVQANQPTNLRDTTEDSIIEFDFN